MGNFKTPSKELYFSKNDPLDPRLGELFSRSDEEAKWLCLLGYPDDEGIKRNGGRIGAKEGPDQIRHWLFRMTPPSNLSHSPICDLGNLEFSNEESLESRHEKASLELEKQLKKNALGLTFGGGHDYGYPDGKAFLNSFKDTKPLIINFDAHLDVRNLERGVTSGTPFFRLRSEFDDFEMVQVGIQSQCNSKEHLSWCLEKGIGVLFLNDFYGKADSLKEIFERTWKHHVSKDRPAFISIDIDGFSSAFAPGCSQSWPTGIEPREFFELFDWLLNQLDVRLVSIYEVAPSLDVQSVTSKLAAQIAYRFMEVSCQKTSPS